MNNFPLNKNQATYYQKYISQPLDLPSHVMILILIRNHLQIAFEIRDTFRYQLPQIRTTALNSHAL